MTVLKCLFCLLFSLLLFSAAGTLSAQESSQVNGLQEIEAIENLLMDLQAQIDKTKSELKNTKDYLNLIEKNATQYEDLLKRSKEELKNKGELLAKLESTLQTYEGLLTKLKASSTIKNWIIGGLAVSLIGSYFIGWSVGKWK